jgi:hypothetical protein
MEVLIRPLLWEIVRYNNNCFFSLECTSKTLHNRLTSDLSYFYYFLEEVFEIDDVRGMDFREVKDVLFDIL